MSNSKKFIVSHAPYWHNGSSVCSRNFHMIFAALPAVIVGIYFFRMPALRVILLSMGSAMLWELLFTHLSKLRMTIDDGNAALIGLLFGMMIPATCPWWFVIIGTFLAVIIGKSIYGGIGANPFHPTLIAIAILMLSWPDMLDYYGALVNYTLPFPMTYPLETLKYFGTEAIKTYSLMDLFIGKQVGGIGSTCGLALCLGGVYLILRGFIRWEISISYIVGILITSHLFSLSDPIKYAGPMFHLLTGYTLIGAFFIATEDSSSPVNFIPMLIYGAGAGFLTILIRNIGAYADGVVFAILLMNLANPIIDRIRPKAIGKGVCHA